MGSLSCQYKRSLTLWWGEEGPLVNWQGGWNRMGIAGEGLGARRRWERAIPGAGVLHQMLSPLGSPPMSSRTNTTWRASTGPWRPTGGQEPYEGIREIIFPFLPAKASWLPPDHRMQRCLFGAATCCGRRKYKTGMCWESSIASYLLSCCNPYNSCVSLVSIIIIISILQMGRGVLRENSLPNTMNLEQEVSNS